MTIERAYLDYNASAPLRPEALAVMFDIYARPGNASSVHGEGRYYRKCVEAARAQVADLVAAEPDGDVFFPELDYSKWRLLSEEAHSAGEKDDHAFNYKVYERKKEKA